MNNTVFSVNPIRQDEALTCYLLRLATSESVPGISGLLAHMGFGISNAAINKNIKKIAAFTRQPEDVLHASRICVESTKPTLKEKYASFTSHPYCPHCVREHGYFKSAWRHGLVTACPEHSCKLVDHCPSCSSPIKLARANLYFCDCGQELASIPTAAATPESVWISSGIAGSNLGSLQWPDFGNTQNSDWKNFDELIFLMGSYAIGHGHGASKPRRTAKFESLDEANQFLQKACEPFENFPSSFEEHVKHRLEQGDKTKAGLANRLGFWFREFRLLTKESFPHLRAAFARSVIANFDGHDSKNPWIYEFGTQHFLSITEASKKLGVKSSRLRLRLANMPEAAHLKENTFNTVSVEIVEKLQIELASAFNQVEVLERTGVTEAVLKQFSEIGLIPRRKRKDWDLNIHKNFDVADVVSAEALLLIAEASPEPVDGEVVGINDINNRLSTNKAVVRELFEKMALGELKPVNTTQPTKIGQVVFSKADVATIIGNSHQASKVTIEHLSRMTGWKSESIRHWVSQRLLSAEEGQLRGKPTYWVDISALHKFMSKYRVVSELASQLGTSPKALTEKLVRLGIPIVGAKKETSTGASRGGLVEQLHLYSPDIYQLQSGLFVDSDCCE